MTVAAVANKLAVVPELFLHNCCDVCMTLKTGGVRGGRKRFMACFARSRARVVCMRSRQGPGGDGGVLHLHESCDGADGAMRPVVPHQRRCPHTSGDNGNEYR